MKIQKIRVRLPNQIKAILTPKQRQRYDFILARLKQRRTRRATIWLAGKDGGLKGVRVVVGISDASHTEIVRGNVKPGDTVVIGIDRSGGKGRGRRSPRLRL